jgi:hypothetical protein
MIAVPSPDDPRVENPDCKPHEIPNVVCGQSKGFAAWRWPPEMMRMRGDMACFHEPFGEA